MAKVWLEQEEYDEIKAIQTLLMLWYDAENAALVKSSGSNFSSDCATLTRVADKAKEKLWDAIYARRTRKRKSKDGQ